MNLLSYTHRFCGRPIFFSKQKENGIASIVGIKPVGFDQALDTG